MSRFIKMSFVLIYIVFDHRLMHVPDPNIKKMTLKLGDLAPEFTAETTQGDLSFHEWKKGSWTILFSHPEDFTPVCTTELGAVAKLSAEWAKRNVKVIGLSCNSLNSHDEWIKDINETQVYD